MGPHDGLQPRIESVVSGCYLSGSQVNVRKENLDTTRTAFGHVPDVSVWRVLQADRVVTSSSARAFVATGRVLVSAGIAASLLTSSLNADGGAPAGVEGAAPLILPCGCWADGPGSAIKPH